MKKRAFEIIQQANPNDFASRIFDTFIITLIIVNLIIIIVETFSIPNDLQTVLNYAETISVIIFSAEYILRVWTADSLYPRKSPLKARIKYIFSFMALIDLLAILPFYLPLFIPIDLRVLRTVRVIRLLRIFKINRYTNALNTIGQVFKNKASQLISSIMVVGLLMIISSVLMYNIENSVQPGAFSNAIETMWWTVTTLTTVGYGDVYPITASGKILATIISFLGIGMVAVPTGIITAGFSELLRTDANSEEDEKKYCPYCGHKIDK
ncbi:MAG: ion transporter [Ruminococcus sp.]|nr:ion transporter [Ruminococcus sp.]